MFTVMINILSCCAILVFILALCFFVDEKDDWKGEGKQ